MTSLTFYGGVHEIGGNKFLIEDRGTRLFLDFGMQMGKYNQYFAEFVNPRSCNALGDLFEFEMLPKLKGLYRRDYAKHMDFDGDEDTEFHAVLLSHAHVDHSAYIHYLRPDIPIYCSEATKFIMQALQDTGGGCDQYIVCSESFQMYKNKKGEVCRGRGEKYQRPRKIITFENLKKFNIDSIEVEPIAIDHSLPGVCGFILHTSNGSIGYTADIRFHGRRESDTKGFVEKCKNSDIKLLLCEGTRVNENFSKTELDVEEDIKTLTKQTRGLIICTYPRRDLDRLQSFYNAAKACDRNLVIDLKQAYLLKLFQTSDSLKELYPKPDDKNIKIYIPRKLWGLLYKDINLWTKRQLLADYESWEEEFLNYPNKIDGRDVHAHQNELIFYCNDFQLQQLIDIGPDKQMSNYIRSSTEPFDEEMELDESRVKRWLVHFGLLADENSQWYQTHVSGHGSGDQIRKIIEESEPVALIPIHTEHEEYHKKWHKNVIQIHANGGSTELH